MRSVLMASLLILVGCAGSANWHNSNLPPAQEAVDERQCRKEAEEDIGPTPYAAPGNPNSDTPLQMYDRSELRRRFEALVADCMESKGYRQEK